MMKIEGRNYLGNDVDVLNDETSSILDGKISIDLDLTEMKLK